MRSIDVITLEVIRNAAILISEEMGIVLRGTAYSPNIRDRADCTAAILNPEGELVAQAEHIPVHIGSMSVGVMNTMKFLEREGIDLEPGDVILTNDPYIAGTHLNDVLVLKPVFYEGDLVAIVANKAHHVDVGGIVPGSISSHAKDLLEEGLVIPPVKIIRKGVLDRDLVRILESNVRTPRYLKGDLMAQIAALNVGEKRVLELASKYGKDLLLKAWSMILNYAERYARNKVKELGIAGSYEAEDYLELSSGGLINIRARLTFRECEVEVDFSGSHKQVDEPINAVYGVTVAATTYALKSVIDPEMPINSGFYRVVKISAPLGSIVNPIPPAPVAAGNVETSQRIVDVVFKALHKALPHMVPAASCGSMNNVMLGGIRSDGTRWTFYETIGCGSGARPSMDGVDGVHTNMTNTMNTPIEVIEHEYPLQVVMYSLRDDSEGPGKYRGGLGIIRAIKVLEDHITLTIVGERVLTRPWGLSGGYCGKSARYYVVKASGDVIELKSKSSITLDKGDVVYIETGGGGGFGNPCERDLMDILRDVLEGKVSIERASKKYCVDEELLKELRDLLGDLV